MKQRYAMAKQWILEMGDYLKEAARLPFSFSQKTSHHDIVTAYDREVEKYFHRNIHNFFPEDDIVGEEFGCQIRQGSGIKWYIDPIDGTTNFVNFRKNFAVSVGCYENDIPQFALVLDVIGEDLYQAFLGEGAYKNGKQLKNQDAPEDFSQMILSTSNVQDTFWRGYPWQDAMRELADQVRAVRCLGSVALELCSVSEGNADIFIAIRSSPWDHNAARLILQESGCVISRLGQNCLPADESGFVIACRKESVYKRLKELYQL